MSNHTDNLTTAERERRLVLMDHRQEAFNRLIELKAQAIDVTPAIELLEREIEILNEMIDPTPDDLHPPTFAKCVFHRVGSVAAGYIDYSDCPVCGRSYSEYLAFKATQ